MARSKSSRPAREPTFADAQKWWSKMRRPVTFPGVPGHPFQPAALWNTGLLFWPVPRNFTPDGPRHTGPPALMGELAGYETDALHVEFAFGRSMHVPDRKDNTAGDVSQELLDGRMPVIIHRLTRGGLAWTCTVFCRIADGPVSRTGDEVLLTEVQWTAKNTTARRQTAALSAHLAAPHVVLGYKVAMQDRAAPYQRALTWEAPLLTDDRGRARLAAVASGGQIAFHAELPPEALRLARQPLAKWGIHRDVLTFSAPVAAGRSVSLRLLIPYFAAEPQALTGALGLRAGGALAGARAYWKKTFDAAGRIETPEPIVNDSADAYLYHAMIATGRRPRSAQWILKTSPNNYEGLWGAHAAIAAFSMDLRGVHDGSRPVFDGFLANQGPAPVTLTGMWGRTPAGATEGFSAHPGFLGNLEGHMAILWAFYHGWTMWAIGQHARLTGDWAWLRKHADRLALACEWIADQRRRTKRKGRSGRKVLSYGLLPASNAFDWGFGHMFWSDAHTYRGLAEAADVLRRIGHARAGEFAAEADAYRRDIVEAVTRCRDAAPRVLLDDGTKIPFVPMSVEMRNYFAPDWTYVACGPLNLAWAGVVPADHDLMNQTLAFLDAGRPLGRYLRDKKEYEGWDWAPRTPADRDFNPATRPRKGRARFWRHKMTYEPGWIPQAFAFMARDEMPNLLEHFYSLISNGGQHVEIRSPIEQRDGVAWTQPGDANLLWLVRSFLLRELSDRLILAGSTPRAWLADGRRIAVDRMPTHFGPVSYQLESRVGHGTIRGTFGFAFRTAPERILLRLRHPDGLLPSQVRINGVLSGAADGEWVRLPATCRNLEVKYARD